ncbi:MAG: hypothetical protein IPI12_07875 [Ignavibacteriales bacterium]|nr:hypothetical protein [Ignavibacteriales bacterium]
MLKVQSQPTFTLDDLGNAEEQVPRLMDGINNPDSKRRFVQKQSNFSKIPGSPIAYWVSERVRNILILQSLKAFAGKQGMATADNERFLRYWQDVSIYCSMLSKNGIQAKYKWFRYNKGGEFRRWYGN